MSTRAWVGPARALWLVIACTSAGLAGCSDDSAEGTGSSSGGSAADAQSQSGAGTLLTCVPDAPRMCPCAGGGSGSQLCLASGDAYGPCTGCPAPDTGGGDPSGAASSGSAGDGAGTADGAAADSGKLDSGMADAGRDAGPGDGMVAPDAGDEPVAAGPAPGPSCGVGLPVQCALDGEKCCVRSLRTDTCIGAGERCECDLPNCDVMEAYCDGPEDCPQGQVCCGTLGGSTYTRFECASNCDYAGAQRIACHQETAMCPGNNVCANSQLLTNLQVCIDPATIRQ